MHKPDLKILITSLTLSLCLPFAAARLNAQEAYKIDEAMAPRCDLSEVPQITDSPMPLFKALNDDKEARAAIVVYGIEGFARRYASNVKGWLAEVRGVEAQRLVTVYGGAGEELRLELWIIPKGASLPKLNPTEDEKTATLFDHFSYRDGETCASGRLPALAEFAESLQRRSGWQGYLIIHPHKNRSGSSLGDAGWDSGGYLSHPQALRRVSKDKRYLIRKFGLASTRLKAVVGDKAEGTYSELWLVPPGAEPPLAKAKSLTR